MHHCSINKSVTTTMFRDSPTSLGLGEPPFPSYLLTAAEMVCIMEMVVFAVTATLPSCIPTNHHQCSPSYIAE